MLNMISLKLMKMVQNKKKNIIWREIIEMMKN